MAPVVAAGAYELASDLHLLNQTAPHAKTTSSTVPSVPAFKPTKVPVDPSMPHETVPYTVTFPDSDELPVVVHNSGGILSKTQQGVARAAELGFDIVEDLIVAEGKNMARKGVQHAKEFVIEKIKGKKPAKQGPKMRSGTKQELAIIPRNPPSVNKAPYALTKAPVSYGATLAGSRTIVAKTAQGHVLRGREFLGSAYDTTTITSWTMCLGAPLTPVSFVDSMIKQYGSMYNYFRWRKLRVHYVTTSPTTTSGSVMLYYNKDRASTYINQTSANLLPFVLSDPHTTIGPQWQNFVVDLEPDSEWKRLDYGLTDDSTHYSAGEVFLLSKTAANADSPGMLLMEYEIEFKDENLTPRLLLWPQPTINYVPYLFGLPATSTAGSAVTLTASGTPKIGTNTNYLKDGGIYKVILDMTNSGNLSSTTPATTANTLWKYPAGTGTYVAHLVDGTTLYAVNGPTSIQFFTNLSDAYVNNSPVQWFVTLTANGGVGLTMWLSLLGFVGDSAMNPNM